MSDFVEILCLHAKIKDCGKTAETYRPVSAFPILQSDEYQNLIKRMGCIMRKSAFCIHVHAKTKVQIRCTVTTPLFLPHSTIPVLSKSEI